MAGGRPAFYSSPQRLQRKIDAYFKNCPDFVIVQEYDLKNNKLIEYKKDYLTDMRLDGGVGHGFSTEGRTCGHSSLASTPQNSTSAPLFRCPEPPFLIPQNTIWDIPFCHLGYIFGTFVCL